MINQYLITIVRLVFQLLYLVVLMDVIASFLLPPFNKTRLLLEKIVNPLFIPIRRIVPPIQSIDLSPIILIIILEIIRSILTRILTIL
jgi:YggT family protein